jgi:transketolase
VTPPEPDDAASRRIAQLRASYPQKSIRQQFGETMLQLAAEHPQLLALTADLMFATGMEAFGASYPDRLINLGIAEQNMTGVAAGLALCGKLPIICGYAAFTTLRAVEQAKLDCAYNAVKVILTAQSAGLSYGVGGPTHQTFEDVAIMRAIPNMIVVVPSDTVEMDAMLRACVAHDRQRPIYVRLGRGPEYVYNTSPQRIEIGKAISLREGRDLCIIANGAMVFEAILAADTLSEEGIGVQVMNMHTVKPIDGAAILAAAGQVSGMLVVEEHNVFGGLGSAVLEVLDGGHACPVRRIGIEDVFPPIGPPFKLRAALGLSAAHIASHGRAMLDGA